jgi:ABC-2 type transport system ATP-binding protein
MTQAEQICDHVVMIHNGRKVLDDRVADLRGRFDPRRVIVEPLHADAGPTPFERIPGVESVTSENGSFELALHAGTETNAVMHAALAAAPLARIELRRPTLEDIFITTVAGANQTPDATAELWHALREPSSSEGGRR